MSATSKNPHSKKRSLNRRLWLVGILALAATVIPNLKASAATLSTASVALSDPRPAFTSSYTFTGSSITTGTAIQCIEMVFSTTQGGVTVPTNMITTGATIDAAGTNYVTAGSLTMNHTTNGTLLMTATSGLTPASSGPRTVEVDGILNSSLADTGYYLTFSTFTSSSCTGPVDNATAMFINTNGSTLTLSVNDTLTFSVNTVASGQSCDGTTSTLASTPTTISFGVVTPATNQIICQDLTAATNATNGYSVYVRETAAPTNALGQTIASTTGTNLAPAAFPAAGTEAYGYSTNDATLSNTGNGPARFTSPVGWAAMTTTNAEVGYTTAPSNPTTYRVGHQVGISTVTKPGTYTTTIIYTCTPIY